MDAALSPWLWIVVLLLVGVGLAGTVLPMLPGVPMIFIGLWLAAWIDGYERVGGLTMGLLGVLTLLSVVIDFAASAMGAKRVGASPRAIWGAAIGSIVGLFFGLPGLLLGPFVGAVAGELSAQKTAGQATRVGIATWLGLLFGTLAKIALSFAMIGVFVLFYFL
ncbi:DUF456 domain-containing protein [Solimonas sp. K1W22B-7]|uniref:DUF456 domain-containing protein n=1 Tax=Solimonas sp. K1W22B-7 TaxID=2303331 RepID=UPI000E333C9A|nr:DUF456 domain-containing protein [Solimonas sp. K1W22B-7]AXQ31226.1 DUF456 domain-containing protein [Solimonas sp. K1W22B-7]